jgi:hypothetical protein
MASATKETANDARGSDRFDSAWTDSSKNPGAATAYVIEGGSARPSTRRALPNHDEARPVRVASSLISTLGGGVQPARKGGKMGARI